MSIPVNCAKCVFPVGGKNVALRMPVRNDCVRRSVPYTVDFNKPVTDPSTIKPIGYYYKKFVAKLGKSLTRPFFPTEFNKNTFIEWAVCMGYDYESRGDAVRIIDKKTGNEVRRIVRDEKDPKKVRSDHIWIFDKHGNEINQYLKRDGAPLKYYYNRTSDGIYLCAELHNGLWCDGQGKVLPFNPITGRPQKGYKKPDSFMGDLLTPSFPEDFDVPKFEKWAAANNLTLTINEKGEVEFRNTNNKLVRRISKQRKQTGKIQEDNIWIPYLNEEDESAKAKFSRFFALKGPVYSWNWSDEDHTFTEHAQLLEIGGRKLWCHYCGPNAGEPLPQNPVTGERQ